MSYEIQFLALAVLIGVGATVLMDLWALFIRCCFGTPSLNFAMVGRWVGYLPRGRFVHDNIARTAPVRGEAIVGWAVHYATGMVFAIAFLAIIGQQWLREPSFFPPVVFGILTIVAPFFVLQPGLGAGIAASRTPQPTTMRLRSLMAHTSFGVGLYASAWATKLLFRF